MTVKMPAPKDAAAKTSSTQNLTANNSRRAQDFRSYLRLLGMKTTSMPRLIEEINNGLPYRTFEQLHKNLKLGVQETADLVRISPTTLSRRKEQGRFQADEGEKIVRLSRLFSRALELFDGDEEAARKWLTTPKGVLGGAAPFEMAKSELGAQEVERLIGRLEHGVFS